MAIQWTKAQDQQLLALFRAGTPNSEIARQLDRPNSSIRSRLVILGEIEYGIRQRQAAVRQGNYAKAVRNCLCCSAEFMSDGPHNRLCGRCRTKDTSPYAH